MIKSCVSHNARSDITKELLQKLYWKQKLSSNVVGKKLACDPATIRNRLRYFSLPVRTLKEAHRCMIFTKFPGKILHPKHDFNGEMPRKAYLIGFRLGDLWVGKVSPGPYCQTLQINCRTTQPEQMILFEQLFRKYGYLHQCKPDQQGAFSLSYYVNRSFDFLLPKHDHVETWIQNDPRCAAAFAAGYTDAEGSFHIVTTKNGAGKAVFAVASQDQEILKWFYSWLQSVGIECKPPKLAIPRGTPRQFALHKDYWILQVCRKEALLKLVVQFKPWVQHPKRKKDMQRVVQNIYERNASPNLKFTSRTHRTWVSKLAP